jgi:hypothetical protein
MVKNDQGSLKIGQGPTTRDCPPGSLPTLWLAQLDLACCSTFEPNCLRSPDHSPVKSSHASNRMNIETHHAFDKGKSIATPSSPSIDSDKSLSSQMHLKGDCSYVISEIKPKGLAQPKVILGK